MNKTTSHVAHVFTAPLRGVYSTHTFSAREFSRHWHDSYGFGVLEQGAHRSASGRGLVDAYAGNVITTNPGEVHDGRPLAGTARRWRIVHMDAGVLESLTDSSPPAEITRPVICDPPLAAVLRRLFRRLERWSVKRPSIAGEALACEESLVQASVLLMTRHGTRPSASRSIGGDARRLRDRLADDLLDPPSLADLAAMTALSKYQVLRCFQRAYGLPPHAWLLSERAERARQLIRNGSTLASAAAASGFADQSHMTRVFVRRFGFTPGYWKTMMAPQ
jgi:AraC-like DNA-binding protein